MSQANIHTTSILEKTINISLRRIQEEKNLGNCYLIKPGCQGKSVDYSFSNYSFSTFSTPLSRSAQRLPCGRHRVPPGSTLLRALAREKTGGRDPKGAGRASFSSHQRRAVRETVREERAGPAGGEEHATKPRASPAARSRKREQGDGAEHGRPSAFLRTENQRSGGRHRTQ